MDGQHGPIRPTLLRSCGRLPGSRAHGARRRIREDGGRSARRHPESARGGLPKGGSGRGERAPLPAVRASRWRRRSTGAGRAVVRNLMPAQLDLRLADSRALDSSLHVDPGPVVASRGPSLRIVVRGSDLTWTLLSLATDGRRVAPDVPVPVDLPLALVPCGA